jgi:MFS superfamily sulfate permease-like transporter
MNIFFIALFLGILIGLVIAICYALLAAGLRRDFIGSNNNSRNKSEQRKHSN